MAAVSCSTAHTAGAVASARAPVARARAASVAAAAPRVNAASKLGASKSFMGAAERRALALTAARGKAAAGSARRGFEVVAQAISEVRGVKRHHHAGKTSTEAARGPRPRRCPGLRRVEIVRRF